MQETWSLKHKRHVIEKSAKKREVAKVLPNTVSLRSVSPVGDVDTKEEDDTWKHHTNTLSPEVRNDNYYANVR